MEIRTYRAIKAPPGEAEMVTSFWKLGTILLPLTFSHFYYDVVESCSAPPTSCFHKVPRTGGQPRCGRPSARPAVRCLQRQRQRRQRLRHSSSGWRRATGTNTSAGQRQNMRNDDERMLSSEPPTGEWRSALRASLDCLTEMLLLRRHSLRLLKRESLGRPSAAFGIA